MGPSAPRMRAVDQLAGMAALAAIYDASAPRGVAAEAAEEAQPEAGLEDLRLRTPALRPVGCWCTGCGAPAACSMLARSLLSQVPRLASAPGARRCGNLSGASEAGLRLLTCSGCNVARYCSPACHKAAWRAGHRGACQRLRERA